MTIQRRSRCPSTGDVPRQGNQDLGEDTPPKLLPDTDFQKAQEQDPSGQLREEVAVINRQVRDPRWALRYPHIEKEGGVWWRVAAVRADNRDWKQLVVAMREVARSPVVGP